MQTLIYPAIAAVTIAITACASTEKAYIYLPRSQRLISSDLVTDYTQQNFWAIQPAPAPV